ncbi:MAG: tetratricopeptide repeat protein [Flavisolibacter sp.]
MMKRPQWITAGIAILLVIGLFAATRKEIFGPHAPAKIMAGQSSSLSYSTDSILFHAKESLSEEQMLRLNTLEHSISRGDVKEQKLHIYHQLASFWADSAGVFPPAAWYTAEAARLENSEKSLTFAAHLLLNNLVDEASPLVRQWEAFQAKDLFERSLKLNPDNDSSRVGLGAVYVYGGFAMPMEGIGMIRKVADKDTTNVFAQMTLGKASLMSGQLEKASERFKRVASLQPSNLEAIIRVAETEEQLQNNAEAVRWYSKLLPLITNQEMKNEVEARIARLKNRS